MLYSLLHHLITDWLGKPADVPYFYKSALFRATVGHSFAMALIIGGITLIQAYLLPGLVR